MRTLVRRWYWWLPALLVAAGVGYVGYRLMHPPWEGAEAWEKYERVRLGMTFGEPKEALGEGWVRCFDTPGGACHFWHIGEDTVALWIDYRPADGDYILVSKAAMIRGYEFIDPPPQHHWWDRWRARVGW
jgi:hypothetical protein